VARSARRRLTLAHNFREGAGKGACVRSRAPATARRPTTTTAQRSLGRDGWEARIGGHVLLDHEGGAVSSASEHTSATGSAASDDGVG
jgi:hypothetical protein